MRSEPRSTWRLHASRLGGKLRTDIAPDIDTFYLCDIERRADVARRDRRFFRTNALTTLITASDRYRGLRAPFRREERLSAFLIKSPSIARARM